MKVHKNKPWLHICCSDLNLEPRSSLAGEAPSFCSLGGRCRATSLEKKVYRHQGKHIHIDIYILWTTLSRFWTKEWQVKLYLDSHLKNQFPGKASETSHLRHGADPTDLHAAGLVIQSDSGAATVLRGPEEPRVPSHDEGRPDLQQGQLRLSFTETLKESFHILGNRLTAY